MSDGANRPPGLPESVRVAGEAPPPNVVDFMQSLEAYGAERMLVFTNESTGETSIDFESPLPGDAPQRASVKVDAGRAHDVTLRLGVLDEDKIGGHASRSERQNDRLEELVRNLNPPGGSVTTNFGDLHYAPRPHILLNWRPGGRSVADLDSRHIRTAPPEPIQLPRLMNFIERATAAVGDEFEGEFDHDNGVLSKRVYASKNVPDLVEPSDRLKTEIKVYYLENMEQYGDIFEELARTKDVWGLATRDEREAMLKISYIQAVLSVQVDWEFAEAAFEAFMEGATLKEAMEQEHPGLVTMKLEDWMYPGLAKDAAWENALDELSAGNVMKAHGWLLGNRAPFRGARAGRGGGGIQGVGDAKAPFTLSNLGFVQKMCIDANIVTLFDADKPQGLSVEEYEGVCEDIRDFFPELSSELEPAQIQWVLFDFQRALVEFEAAENPVEKMMTEMLQGRFDPVATHDVWFRYMPGDMPTIRQRATAATREAKEFMARDIDVPPDVPPDQPVSDVDIVSEIESAIGNRLS